MALWENWRTGSLSSARQNENPTPCPLRLEPKTLMRLFQPLSVEAKFLSHLDQFLRGFRIVDGFGEPSGSAGLLSIMVGLGHGSTFLDEYR